MRCSVNLFVFGCGAACGQGLRTQFSMRMHFLLSAPSLQYYMLQGQIRFSLCHCDFVIFASCVLFVALISDFFGIEFAFKSTRRFFSLFRKPFFSPVTTDVRSVTKKFSKRKANFQNGVKCLLYETAQYV